MSAAIVQSLEIVTLLGASAPSRADLLESLTIAPLLVAADGGADVALSFDLIPDAVIGDLDSITGADRIPSDRLHRIPEQDSTDFHKCLRQIEAPLILAHGFTGGRLDHELAVYNALILHTDRPVIVIGAEDICFHTPPMLKISLPAGCRVSLFPMAELGCASTGLKWPTDHLTFAPWGRVGTSNIATGDVTLRPSREGLLTILPRAQLPAAITALRG